MTATGAVAQVVWQDGGHYANAIFSFGEYDEKSGTDGYGRNDDLVFFYVADETELKTLLEPNNGTDFIITGYELLG
jgi:hypothetical protein